MRKCRWHTIWSHVVRGLAGLQSTGAVQHSHRPAAERCSSSKQYTCWCCQQCTLEHSHCPATCINLGCTPSRTGNQKHLPRTLFCNAKAESNSRRNLTGKLHGNWHVNRYLSAGNARRSRCRSGAHCNHLSRMSTCAGICHLRHHMVLRCVDVM